MDELKLTIWKERFLAEAAKIDLATSAYGLSLNESDELCIVYDKEPTAETKEQLTQLLEATKPEDSV